MKAILIREEYNYPESDDYMNVIRAEATTEWEEVEDMDDATISEINAHINRKRNSYNCKYRLITKEPLTNKVVKESLAGIIEEAKAKSIKAKEAEKKRLLKAEKAALAKKISKEEKEKLAYLKLKDKFEKDKK